MGAPLGSRNNPKGRPAGGSGRRAVPFSVRIAPDVALWIEVSAKAHGVKAARIINDGLRIAMKLDKMTS